VDWNRSCIVNTFHIFLDDLASIWNTFTILGIDIDFGRHRVVERPWVGDKCFTSPLLVACVDIG
jgi:hypothetical protein